MVYFVRSVVASERKKSFRNFYFFDIILLIVLMAMTSDCAAFVKEPQWNGKGKYRILVRVEPRNIGIRISDEMPARIHISREDVYARTGTTGKIDVATLQVEQYNPVTGQPVKYGKWFYARTEWEVPYRWYDDSIQEDFPEVVGNINPETGELKFVPQRNWGYLNETLGEWDGGNLAWTHTQEGNKPSYYAIYFDLLPVGSQPDELPRTGFVGDGTERIEETGASTHGLFLSRGEVADWNGDGLSIFWWEVRVATSYGTRTGALNKCQAFRIRSRCLLQTVIPSM